MQMNYVHSNKLSHLQGVYLEMFAFDITPRLSPFEENYTILYLSII